MYKEKIIFFLFVFYPLFIMLKLLFSDYEVKQFYGCKLGWLPINEKVYSKNDALRIAHYMRRIHSSNIFKIEQTF